MIKKFKDVDSRWKTYALAGCATVLFYVLITHLDIFFRAVGKVLDMFRPVIIGAVIAYILVPLAEFFDRKVFKWLKKEKARWSLSVTVTVVLTLAFLSLLLSSLIPQLISSIQSLLDNVEVYLENLVNFAATAKPPFKELLEQLVEFANGVEGPISRLGELIADNLSGIIETTSHIGSRVVSVLIGAVIAIYLLGAKDMIHDTVRYLAKLLLPERSFRQLTVLGNKFNDIFSKYILCELLDALIIGGVNFLVMVIFRMPNALVISVLVGVTNLAPTFGPIVGAVGGAFILLLVKPGCVIPFLILTLVLQALDAYVIKPRLFGGALNVPGVLILVAIIALGRLWGVVGILIAIPVAALLVYIYVQILIPWLEKRKGLRAEGQEAQTSEETPPEAASAGAAPQTPAAETPQTPDRGKAPQETQNAEIRRKNRRA